MPPYNKYGKQLFFSWKAVKILEKGKGEKDSYGDQVIKLNDKIVALKQQVRELRGK